MNARVWFCLVFVLAAPAASPAWATTLAGTAIANTATLTYSDSNGLVQTVASNTVSATVAAVSAVAVGPKEQGCNPQTDAVSPKTAFTRIFPVTNGGNLSETFAVTAATTTGTVVSLAVVGAGGATTPLQNGASLPPLASGATTQVQVTVNPGSASSGTDIEVSLTATSTTAGGGTDTGQQCAIVSSVSTISGPGGPGTPILKLVNGEPFTAALPGATVTFSIAFMNSGSVSANNLVVTDVVPAGLVPSASGVTLNGAAAPAGAASVSGQTVAVTIPTLAPQAQEIVTFVATVGSSVLGQTFVNTAQVAAQGIAAQTSVPASVLVGTGNIVYDGLNGQSAPVPGAVVTVTTMAGGTIAPKGSPFPPNTSNANPDVTGTPGAYSFGLSAKQFDPTSYLVTIVAPGYLNRRIRIDISPNGANNLYAVMLTSLDGQLLAVPGGFALEKGPVRLQDVYGLFGNLPLFRAQNITVTKEVDRPFASSGDRLVYSVTFANVSTALGATTVVDTLPAGVVYAPGTGRVDKFPQEPKVVGRVLTWTLPDLDAQHVITYAAVILPGTEEDQLLTNDVTVSAQVPASPGTTVSASASVQTQVIAGVFTDRTVVTGRVFYDVKKTGDFRKGDVGIGGVRVYLEDGESVVTDNDGRYDFPGVRPGMHVVRIDVTTLPAGAKPYDDGSLAWDDQRSVRRLVHGPFDGGLIEDINFALDGAP